MARCPEGTSSALLWAAKNAGSAVLVHIFGVGSFGLLRFQFGVLGLECVRNVLEENQTENDVLLLGRVHVVAQRIRRRPKLRLKSKWGAIRQEVNLRSLGLREEE